MTEKQYLIKRKLNVLDFADQMKNISEACRKLGVSRQHYYDIKNTLSEEGIEGLMEKTRKVARVGNRCSPEVEDAILAYSLLYPTHGQVRVSNELNRQNNWKISGGGVRSVWMRHQLEKKFLRLKRLEKWSAENHGILTESQIKAMEEQREEKEACGEIETHHSGFLFSQDSYYVGYIKGIGKIYQQTGIDTYSNVGFAKLYSDKTATAAAEFLNSKVLPFFDEQRLSVLRILTDRGTEYCGRPETHHYQLFLYLNDIEHSKTKVRHPQTNGSCEKLNQTIQEEFYSVAFRKKLYKTIEEIQEDLDTFMRFYNFNRTNQGKRCKGRTPFETFTEGKELYQKLVYEGGKEKERPIRRWEPEVEIDLQ
jgi:hypothetical protein